MSDEMQTQAASEAARRYPLPAGYEIGEGTPEGVARVAFLAGVEWARSGMTTEWGVCVDDPKWAEPVYRIRKTRALAEQYLRDLRGVCSEYGRRVTATLVSREVTVTEWREVTE